MSALRPFHLAVAVRNIEEARRFYGELLGFAEGRSTEQWIDWNFYGHQFVTHLDERLGSSDSLANISNSVDQKAVPIPHFGVVLDLESWQSLAQRLQGRVEFIIEPYTRFAGQPGEQSTLFFADPSGNALEFKAFADLSMLFAT